MSDSHLVVARLYEHIEPIDRGDRYEDPLDAVLRSAGLGQVTGGGSQLNKQGGIDFADVEIALTDDSALPIVIEALERAGAPEGSEIRSEDGTVREFGTQQCLAVFLDGVSLPDEVYANLDFDRLVTDLGDAAGPESYRGLWQGNEETGMYFYGPDAEQMFTRVQATLAALPIGQNARLVIRGHKERPETRTVRLPRH